ncbi:MAG: hypothetical protein WCL38_04525, partial [Actinomycetota bacterium]
MKKEREGNLPVTVSGGALPRRRGAHMTWDFETEPEFEQQLEWMRTFIREEVFPLETLNLNYDQI